MYVRLGPILTTIVIAFAVSACGSDGDGSGGGAGPAQSAGGIWHGTITGGGNTNDVSCVVAETGDLACALTEPTTGTSVGSVTGSIQVTNGDQLSGSGTSFTAPGFVFPDGSTRANFNITGGIVSERNSIDLTIDTAGVSSTLSGIYDSFYDRDSSLEKVAGVYTDFYILGSPASLSIDTNGSIFSQNTAGCVGIGQVNIIDSRFNAYDVELTISNCSSADGNYSGLGSTTDTLVMDDTFFVGVFTNSLASIASPVRTQPPPPPRVAAQAHEINMSGPTYQNDEWTLTVSGPISSTVTYVVTNADIAGCNICNAAANWAAAINNDPMMGSFLTAEVMTVQGTSPEVIRITANAPNDPFTASVFVIEASQSDFNESEPLIVTVTPL